MTLQEMIELAILDAMGLLDEEERLAFEVAFRASAPAVQAQVRREQTRLAGIESLLPDVSPPAGMRALVVEAVRREMAASAIAGSINPAQALADSMLPSRGVSRGWRAASLGLAAAAVILGITTIWFYNTLEHNRQMMQDSELIALVNEPFEGKVRDVLFSRDTHRVVLTSATSGYKGQASVFMNPEWSEALFFCRAIAAPQGRNLKVAIIDENNKIVRELRTFVASGELKPLWIPLGLKDRGRIAVMTSSADGVEFDSVLVSAELPEQTL